MRNCTFELHAESCDLYRRIPISVFQTHTTGEIPIKDSHPEADQGAENGVASEVKPKTLTAMERLGSLSSFRVPQNAIKFLSSTPHAIGGKAEVLRATLTRGGGTDEEEVAVKKLRYHDGIDKKVFCNELVHEVELMAGLSHKNIIQLTGFVEDFENGKAWIVLSWAPNGNLREFLATGEWEVPERLSLIRGTFSGLKYLHTHQPPIRHGDLKSLNILVSSSYRAMITDFGSARALSDTGDGAVVREDVRGASAVSMTNTGASEPKVTVIATGSQLTLTGPAWSLRWVAPEAVIGEQQTLASDIWSAGWVCWEIMTNKVPFHDINGDVPITFKIIRGEVPAAREDEQLSQIVKLCSLMSDCWRIKPESRPGIAQCYEEVKTMPSKRPLGGRPSSADAPNAELLIEMGRVHLLQDSYKSAMDLFQRALSIATAAGNEKARAAALYKMAEVFRFRGKYLRAEGLYTEALDICTRIGDVLYQGHALFGLAHAYRNQSKLIQSKEVLTRALEMFSLVDYGEGLADTLRALGDVSCRMLDYADAENFYNQAKSIQHKVGDGRVHAKLLKGMGSLHHAQSKYAEAEESYTQARDIYIRLGDSRGQADTLYRLGDACSSQSRYAEAEDHYTQARDIYTRIGPVSHQADTLRRLGRLRHEQGRNDEAEVFYAEAKELLTQVGNIRSRTRATNPLAECQYRTPGPGCRSRTDKYPTLPFKIRQRLVNQVQFACNE